MSRFLLGIALLLVVMGCRGASSGAQPSPPAASSPRQETARPSPTLTPHPSPSPLPTYTEVPAYPPPAPTQGLSLPYPQPGSLPPGEVAGTILLPKPTPFPTFAPDLLRPALLSALQVLQTVPGTFRVSHWAGGWRSDYYYKSGPLSWLDDNRLLLFPLAGVDDTVYPSEFSVPLVADLKQGSLWLPYPEGEGIVAFNICRDQPVWSSPAGVLAAPQLEHTYLFDFQGAPRAELPRQEYTSLSVSPSGRWLFTGQEFINLGAGVQPGPQPPFGAPYAWDPTERQIFRWGYLFAERGSPPVYWEPQDISPVGRDYGPGSYGVLSAWTPDGRYAYNFLDYIRDQDERVIFPLFDPRQQTYVDLLALAGLPNRPMDSIRCYPISVSPDGRLLMISCDAASKFLVDLVNYQARPLGNFTQNNPRFSAGGEFLINDESFSHPEPGSTPMQFWRTADGSTFFQELPNGDPLWHPTRPWLAVLHSGEGGVTLFDARKRRLLAEIQTTAPVKQAIWAQQGNGLLLALDDGQLAWLADPSTSQTPVILNKQAPHPQLRGLRLSPGGRQVALVDSGSVYVYPIP